MTAVSLGYDAV